MKLGKVNCFQAGGAMPAGAAPAPEQGGQDPMQVLLQASQQAIQAQDCQIAMQVCQMLMELAGAGAPAEAAPQEAAPVAAEDQPVYRMGGRLVKRIPRD